MSSRSVIMSLVLALGSIPVHAQQPQAAASASGEDCARRLAPHDHGAERYVPTPRKPCQPKAKADGKAGHTRAPVKANENDKAPQEPGTERR